MLTLTGILCSILFIALLWLVYRYREKSRHVRALRSEVQLLTRQQLDLQNLHYKALAEKEWLIREVHHRVKNNLQLVISLLNMQTGYLKDEYSLDLFGNVGSRIRAISMIHQRMYQEENNMTLINMRDYINELVNFTPASPAPGVPVIDFQLNVESIELDVSQSVPLGLILNEAINNSIKHAFPGEQKPLIVISLSQQKLPLANIIPQPEIGIIRLTIADNGRGLPEDFNLEKNASMGLQLIRTLSAQLDGELRIGNDNGFRLTLHFFRQQHIPETIPEI